MDPAKKHALNDTWVFYYAPRGRHFAHCSTDKYMSYLHNLGKFKEFEKNPINRMIL